MTDAQLVAAFEAGTLPASDFDHAAHVRVAWWLLRHHPLGESIDRFGRALRAFAAAHGAANKYHATTTVAYMLIIADRLASSPALDWEGFAASHADLLERSPSVLSDYYSDDRLQSAAARQHFVMPDRLPRRP